MIRHIPFVGKLLLGFILLFAVIVVGLTLNQDIPLTSTPPTATSPSQADIPTSFQAPAASSTTKPLSVSIPKTPTAPLPSSAALDGLRQQGVMILSMSDGIYSHLFAYHPQFLPLTRLTNNPWDDISPAVSPDGSQVAFGSRQNGYWDIFVMDLVSGKQTRVTDTPEYDGSPTWSPDGQFIAYETLTDHGIQLFIRNTTGLNQAPVQLTFEPGQSFSPSWSPKGREIAFVSTRSGPEDIWLARLDRIDDRFVGISQSGLGRNRSPRWSPGGEILTWASETPGASVLMFWDERSPERFPAVFANGDTPVWSPSGDMLLTEIREPNQVSLSVYRVSDHAYIYPPTRLPGQIHGVDWRAGPVPDRIANFLVPLNATNPASALFQAVLSIQSGLPKNRLALVPLKDVSAPTPLLNDAVDESFEALRQHLSREIGWDFLSQLEQAYLPVTTPSQPGLLENWLYTGRAFAINPVPLNAGWISLIREEIGGQTYWRLYLRCLFQDASQGQPLNQRPWDLNARSSGDARMYDQGGEYGEIPPGYWVDFTELALRYGWERLPAQINWRTYYPATLFGEFVMRENHTWRTAMSQIYPAEVIATPSLWVTLTSTPTLTPTYPYQRLITPSLTPTVTLTPTRRPTLTPVTRSP